MFAEREEDRAKVSCENPAKDVRVAESCGEWIPFTSQQLLVNGSGSAVLTFINNFLLLCFAVKHENEDVRDARGKGEKPRKLHRAHGIGFVAGKARLGGASNLKNFSRSRCDRVWERVVVQRGWRGSRKMGGPSNFVVSRTYNERRPTSRGVSLDGLGRVKCKIENRSCENNPSPSSLLKCLEIQTGRYCF